MELLFFYVATGLSILVSGVMHARLRAALTGRPQTRTYRLWWALIAVASAAVAAGFALHPEMANRFDATPSGFTFPVIALAGLLGVGLCRAEGAGALAYLSSCVWLSGAIGTAAIAMNAGLAWPLAALFLVAGDVAACGFADRPGDVATLGERCS